MDTNLKKDLQKAESCRLTAYQDSRGIWTIGWGHEVFPQSAGPGLVWTQDAADSALESDVAIAAKFAQSLREWPSLDTPCRQNAIIELCFNMQKKWLLFVNTRAAIAKQDWKAAHDGLLNSMWAEEVHSARADRLANYLLTGEYSVDNQ